MVQEALAHAALVFATLAAAFTFATGFEKRISGSHKGVKPLYVYGGVLSLLFLVSIYALFRFAYYASLTSFILNQSGCTPNDVSDYWNICVSIPAHTLASSRWLLPFSGYDNPSGIVISLFLAGFLAFLITMLAGGFLPRVPAWHVIRIGLLIFVFVGYLVISDFYISGLPNEQPFGLFAGDVLFVIWTLCYMVPKWVHDGFNKYRLRLSLLSIIFLGLFCNTCGLQIIVLLHLIDMNHLKAGFWLGQSIFTFLSFLNGVFVFGGVFKDGQFISAKLKQSDSQTNFPTIRENGTLELVNQEGNIIALVDGNGNLHIDDQHA